MCPACRHRDAYELPRRHLYQCKQCGRQTSVTAGTMMHRTRVPLRKWFLTFFLVAKKPGLSAMRLSRELKVSYYVARRMMSAARRFIEDKNCQYEVRSLMWVCERLFRDRPSRTVNPFFTAEMLAMLKELVLLLKSSERAEKS